LFLRLISAYYQECHSSDGGRSYIKNLRWSMVQLSREVIISL
jgi:hypothetical protein